MPRQSQNFTENSPNKTVERLLDQKQEDTVFIIGGGPSMKTCLPDISVLNGRDIIVCNNAYKLYPNALCLHFADKIWWDWHQKPQHKVKEVFQNEITTAALSHAKIWPAQGVTCFTNGDKRGGITTDKTKLNGNNTGHQAINLAVHLEFDQIVLIGFDLNQNVKETHWHNEHERKTNIANFENTMIPGFEKIAPYQEELGFKVYNLNHKSAIRCFEFANLEDFI